jgi:cell division protein FtsL
MARLPKWSFEDGLGPLGTALVLVLPVAAAALFYVWTHITTVQLGYELSEAAEAHQQMLEENRGLRIEVAALKAPERLKELGRTQYRLEPPKTEQVVELRGGKR